MMPESVATRFLLTFKAAEAAAVPRPVIGNAWGTTKVYLMDPFAFAVFDDAGEWDYVSWVGTDQDVWDFEQLPETVKDVTPSKTALETVWRWNI